MTETLLAPTYEGFEDEKLSLAQRSINLPEVQEMMQRLAKFNLGIYMPHIHPEEGGFSAMPEGMVQVEDDLVVSFRKSEDLNSNQAIPVAWTWQNNGLAVGATCGTWCLKTSSGHQARHNQGY